MAKRKKKTKTFVIYADKKYKFGKICFWDIWDTIFYENKELGKNIPGDGSICHIKKGLLHWIHFDKKKGTANVSIEMDLDKLESFVKKAQKRRAYFRKWDLQRKKHNKPKLARIFFKNLNPEITFMFRY